jgi:hypothetical protein
MTGQAPALALSRERARERKSECERKKRAAEREACSLSFPSAKKKIVVSLSYKLLVNQYAGTLREHMLNMLKYRARFSKERGNLTKNQIVLFLSSLCVLHVWRPAKSQENVQLSFQHISDDSSEQLFYSSQQLCLVWCPSAYALRFALSRFLSQLSRFATPVGRSLFWKCVWNWLCNYRDVDVCQRFRRSQNVFLSLHLHCQDRVL